MEFNSGALPVTGVILVKKNELNCFQKIEDMGQGGSYKKTLRQFTANVVDWPLL